MNQTRSRRATASSPHYWACATEPDEDVLWDSRSCLGINPDEPRFTCAGTTQRGARCRNAFISGADLSTASSILDKIDLMPPEAGIPRDLLKQLAELTLCPRWHRKPGYSQVSALANKWKRMIDMHCSAVADAPTRRRVAAPRAGRSEDILITDSQTVTSTIRVTSAGAGQEQIDELLDLLSSLVASRSTQGPTAQPRAQRNARPSTTEVSGLLTPPPSLQIELPRWASDEAPGAQTLQSPSSPASPQPSASPTQLNTPPQSAPTSPTTTTPHSPPATTTPPSPPTSPPHPKAHLNEPPPLHHTAAATANRSPPTAPSVSTPSPHSAAPPTAAPNAESTCTGSASANGEIPA